MIQYVDSIEASVESINYRAAERLNNSIFQIPVNAIVYDNVGYPNISNEEVEDYIAYVNKFFRDNNVLIQLYLRCEIKRMGNSNRAYIDNLIEIQTVFMSNDEPNCINLHFLSDIYDTWSGMARSPWQLNRYSAIINMKKTTVDRRNTTVHEIGHVLGLLHTFHKNDCRNDCFQESVSRSRTQESKCLFTSGKKKCSVNGDVLCDTDADVKNDKSYISSYSSTNVTYKSNAENCKKQDNYGVSFFSGGHNNTLKNIMSYWYDFRIEITKMQKGVMYTYTQFNGSPYSVFNHIDFYKNEDLDAYEPDNYWFHDNFINGRKKIEINTQQYHSFHHAHNSSNNWSAGYISTTMVLQETLSFKPWRSVASQNQTRK